MSYDLPLTLDIVKTQLGITDTTYDAKITATLPEAEARFRQVAGYDFNYVFTPTYETGSAVIKVYRGANSIIENLRYGDIILSEDFPDGTYIIQNYKVPKNDNTGTYYELKLSAVATSADNFDMILCYNISHYAVLSQLVWYMIGEQDIAKVGEKGVKSKSAGPISVSYGDGDTNQAYGLPNKIVKQIPKYQSMS
jgi:hypothetical protein